MLRWQGACVANRRLIVGRVFAAVAALPPSLSAVASWRGRSLAWRRVVLVQRFQKKMGGGVLN